MTKTVLRLKAKPIELVSHNSLNPKLTKNIIFWGGNCTYAQIQTTFSKPPLLEGVCKN